MDKSVDYYRRISRGTPPDQLGSPEHMSLAARTYFAHTKVKNGMSHKAETIYRRLMKEIEMDNDNDNDCDCDFGRLAIPTLLLALMLQREDRLDDARTVFEGFHRSIVGHRGIKCCCSARVMQAFALFEMKQGESVRAMEILFVAIRLDKKVRPVLKWKQFRRAMELQKQQHALSGVGGNWMNILYVSMYTDNDGTTVQWMVIVMRPLYKNKG